MCVCVRAVQKELNQNKKKNTRTRTCCCSFIHISYLLFFSHYFNVYCEQKCRRFRFFVVVSLIVRLVILILQLKAKATCSVMVIYYCFSASIFFF